MYFNQVGDIHYRYKADTTIESVACKKIETTDYNGQYYSSSPYFVVDTLTRKPIYTYAQNDTVFFYYDEFNAWKPVYFFNAQPGDTLVMPNTDMWSNGTATITVVVDSVGTLLVNDSVLSYYHFRLADPCIPLEFKGVAIEKQGMQHTNLRHYWNCVSDDYYYHFCSYKDSTFSLYPNNTTCQLRPVGIEDLSANEITLSLFPNPANEIATISVSSIELEGTIAISDATGKLVSSFAVNKTPVTLLLADYMPGVHIVTLRSLQGITSLQRLVIMQ